MRIHGSGLNNADVSKPEILGVTTVQLLNLTAKHTFAREEIEELKRIILEATMLPMQAEKHDLKLFPKIGKWPFNGSEHRPPKGNGTANYSVHANNFTNL